MRYRDRFGMLHTKLIDATIPVRNPINFCADKRRHSLIALKNTYEGKCFKGAFIVSVDSIEKISDCLIVSTNHSAEGSIDVQFSATVAVFARWDIITGIKIVKADQMVIGTSVNRVASGTRHDDPRDAMVVVNIMPSVETKAIRVEQIVPIRIVSVSHVPMQQHVAAAGTLLTCDKATPTYRLRGHLDVAAAEELMPIVVAIDKELAARAKLVRDRRADVMFFEIMLYSYIRTGALPKPEQDLKIESELGSAEWTGPEMANVSKAEYKSINMLDIVKRATKAPVAFSDLWSRPLELYRSSPIVAQTRASKGSSAIDESPAIALQVFLKSQLEFLFAVRSMVEMYNSKELISSHVNIWTAMRKAQLPPQ